MYFPIFPIYPLGWLDWDVHVYCGSCSKAPALSKCSFIHSCPLNNYSKKAENCGNYLFSENEQIASPRMRWMNGISSHLYSRASNLCDFQRHRSYRVHSVYTRSFYSFYAQLLLIFSIRNQKDDWTSSVNLLRRKHGAWGAGLKPT